MKRFILLFVLVTVFISCKKHKEERLSGIYTGSIDYRHLTVHKETGDTTVYTEESFYNEQVQIARKGDDMLFVREIYALPLKDVKLNKTNVIEVTEDSKVFLLKLDAFPDEIQFIETIQSDLSSSYSYQIFEFKGFKN